MSDFDYQQLDRIIHSRIRLAVMAVLVGVGEAEFTFLREQVKATDGNLSVHLQKLEKAGYISVEKKFVERKPVSTYRLSDQGRTAFEHYISHLENLIQR